MEKEGENMGARGMKTNLPPFSSHCEKCAGQPRVKMMFYRMNVAYWEELVSCWSPKGADAD